MNISTGLSEINMSSLSSGRIVSEKTYLWPVYGEGRVERIQGVTRRTEGNAIYSKPLPEEREKLLELMEASRNPGYTSSGKLRNNGFPLRPGSFFDALV